MYPHVLLSHPWRVPAPEVEDGIVPLHHLPQERTETTCPDCCPGGFPAGQAAAEASEAKNQCGSLKMDALIVKLLQLQRAARRGGRSHLHGEGIGVSPAQV